MLLQFKDAVFVYHLHNENEIKWHSRVHSHESGQYEIHYFLEGTGRFRNNNTTYRITPGSFFISVPLSVHSIRVEKDDKPLTYYAILFTIDQNDESLRKLMSIDLQNKENYNIGAKYRFFFEEMIKKSISHKINLKYSAAHQFISFLYTLAAEGNTLKNNIEGNIHIERALKILQSNVFNDISIQEIAKKLKITEEYFIRLFKAKMNTTPKKYYLKLKIEAANSMLISTDHPLHVIAEKLRFYNEFHFSKIFKQYTGTSPSVYRKEFKTHYKNQSDPVLIQMNIMKHNREAKKKMQKKNKHEFII